MPNPNSKFQFSPLFTLSIMKTFTVFSLVAASMLLAACGSAGSDTAMNASNAPDRDPPSTRTPLIPDTLISSDWVTTKGGNLNVSCESLACAQGRRHYSYSALHLPITGFNKNDKVNGPTRRVVNDDGTTHTIYDYWMGDSMFSARTWVSDDDPSGYNNEYNALAFGTVLGNDTGSRPSGSATYSGKTTAFTISNVNRNPVGTVHHGEFTAEYHFSNKFIDITLDFPDFIPIFSTHKVLSDGTFSRKAYNDNESHMRGAFFGNNHNEVAGSYFNSIYGIAGSFGGIKD